MTHVVLAAMLAGYLALSPTVDAAPGRRKFRPGDNRNPVRYASSPVVPVLPRQVLILDHPFEPSYVYIRIDDAVYALSLRVLDLNSMN